MSCAACREAEQLDAQLPACKTAEGCPIPAPPPGHDRYRRIYDHCQALRGLTNADTIFRLHDVTIDELDFLAIIHQEMQTPEE